ncbi:MAG: AraC family transcriptional regulator, partial [Alphaproteobacteria bacterium]|nr:AraC family transcriptional regulator [Alphaproteobacteria bacterium]
MNFETATFRIPEILSLIGLIQCVYVLVYMAFRAGDIRHAVVPSAYFVVLALAFFLDFAQRFIGTDGAAYPLWQWAAWFMGPPLSVLLVIQVARITRLPGVRHLWLLLLLPLAFAGAQMMAQADEECVSAAACPVLYEWLVTFGLVAGGVSLLAVWLQRGMLDALRTEPGGQARFWLVITLLLMNGAFLGTMLLSLTPWLNAAETMMIRTIIGLGLVYLAGTSLFRIYPQTVKMAVRARTETLTAEEAALAARITHLLDMEKVYQEPTYSRSELARELNAPETVVSRVINVHFGKSFPQLLNEHRVRDAQRLLRETNAAVKQVAEDVGFNSMATFNRVFRDVTGKTPTE